MIGNSKSFHLGARAPVESNKTTKTRAAVERAAVKTAMEDAMRALETKVSV